MAYSGVHTPFNRLPIPQKADPMTPSGSLVLSCAAMVLLTGIVAVRMLLARIHEMKTRRIHPQTVANSRQAAEKYQQIQASDNYRNLIEMPVLFYLVCALVLALNKADGAYALGAWAYVLLRYAHSFIHVTYNQVMHRFAAFLASGVVLAVLWGRLALQSL